jgi:hypothetical protein
MPSYQEGGLAAATGDDPDEQEDPSQVSKYGEQAREISRMSRDKALGRLQQGYDQLKQQKYDRSQKWLALAQGMLAPTKTGAFGESLGVSAGLLREEGKEQRGFEQKRAERLAQMETEMAEAEESYAEREIDIIGEEEKMRISLRAGMQGFNTYVPNPDDPEGKDILVRAVLDPRIKGGMRILELPEEFGGGQAVMPDNLDPGLRYALNKAATLGKLDPKDIDKQIDEVRIAKQRLASSYWGLDLLKKVRAAGGTGGISAYIQRISEVFGSEAEGVADYGMLMALMGDQLFAALEHFGTQINAKELQIAKTELAAGASRSTAVNEKILQQLVQLLEDKVVATDQMLQLGGPSARQLMAGSMPIVNYGLSDEMLGRGATLGFKFRENIPFETEEGPVVPTARNPGDQGSQQNAWDPQTGAEFNEMMNNKERYGILQGDYINVPQPEGAPAKMFRVQ